MDLSAEKIVKNMKAMQGSRMDFDSLYQTLHNYYYVEGSNITAKKNPGNEINTLLDSTSLTAGNVLASGLSNFLTPESSKWILLEHPDRRLQEDKSVQQWMNDSTDEVLLTLSRSNFYNQMPIFYKSSGVYGTAGLFCEKDNRDYIRFYNIPIDKFYLTEDARERPNSFFLRFEYTAEQAVSRFGDKVSDEIKEAYKMPVNEDKKYIFICYIGERTQRDDTKMDKLNMPVRIVWVEEKTQKVVEEGGFNSMPCVAHRFYKRPQIVYGYSPAMEALPHARLANVIQDTVIRASMKQTDPAFAVPDDVFIGTPNFNPRQINYYQRGRMTQNDQIIPIGNYGNVSIGLNELENQRQMINRIMFVDTFQAFNDLTKQMTVPEVMERVSEKMTVLGPAVGRFMNDVLQPLIEKVVAILFEEGRLPELPDAMMENPNFEVKFVSRLIQSQRQTEINNIVSAMSIAGQIAQFKPEVLDIINGDKAVEEVFGIQNINPEMLYSQQEVRELRQARAEAQQQQAALAGANSMANTYNQVAQGEKNEAGIG